MRTLSFDLLHSSRSFLSSLCFVLLAACGGAGTDIGASEQPISGEETDTPAACESGAPVETASSCQVVARGLCFDTAEAACACGGCSLAECAIAESFPMQAICPATGGGTGDPDQSVSDDGSSSDEPASGDEPVSGGGSDGSPGGGSDPGCGAPPVDACASASAAAAAEGRCDFVLADGTCFADDEQACACACGADEQCLILESYPAQVRCGSSSD